MFKFLLRVSILIKILHAPGKSWHGAKSVAAKNWQMKGEKKEIYALILRKGNHNKPSNQCKPNPFFCFPKAT